MAKKERVSTGYLPRPYQDVVHRSLKRFNVLVFHRRWGKTVLVVNEMIHKALANEKRNPQYAYIAPNYAQAKRVAWDMFKDYTKNIPGVKVNESELRIDIPLPGRGDRVRFMLLGAENPGSLRGIYLDGVVLDEFAECDPTIWSQVIRPALSDRKGWAIFIGTPKGQNHLYDMYNIARENQNKGWFAKVYRASETNIIAPEELKDAKDTMSEEEYNQEYECSFTAPLSGSYYGKIMDNMEKEGRITNVPHDPALGVSTFWDLGIGDSTAIWFMQQLGFEYRLIDYIEDSGQGLDHYVHLLSKDERSRYSYVNHIMPHDAAAREMQTGKSRQEAFRRLTGKAPIILPRHKVDDGINATRLILPKCWFDSVKCRRGIDALKGYERKYDNRNKIFSTKPKHNWASHGADAFRIFAMGERDDKMEDARLRLPNKALSDYDLFEI